MSNLSIRSIKKIEETLKIDSINTVGSRSTVYSLAQNNFWVQTFEHNLIAALTSVVLFTTKTVIVFVLYSHSHVTLSFLI